MSFSDERDHAEERANRAEFLEPEGDEEHCGNDCGGVYEDGFRVDEPDDCVHCECCCECLGCEYGPRDGMQLTPEQRGAGDGA